ncbi:putative adenylate kinase 8 [Paratrimastix pyriformis]|uniref:Adenylate kinase 8 n=1 Tax=Paratrimastix pyriformis TaxID=342808 RepID=A0ABQ8UR64_9EUKA|nr:putative adenylate kinase 8 [Paratrimastix pyriformis]
MSKTRTQQELAEYVEKHQIFPRFAQMVQDMCIEKPDDAITYMMNWLQRGGTCRVIIMGCPTSDVRQISANIAQAHKAVHISPGQLVTAESEKPTPAGRELKRRLEQIRTMPGEIVPDEIVVPLVVAKLKSPECRTRGWVLECFPRTRAQAIALRAGGHLPTHVFQLDLPREVALQRMHQAAPGLDVAAIYKHYDRYQLSLRVFQQTYDVRLPACLATGQGVKRSCILTGTPREDRRRRSGAAPQVSAGGGQRSTAPQADCPPGAPNSGVTTQQRRLCERFHLVHVEAEHVLLGAMRESAALEAKLRPFLDARVVVPDEDICPLIEERLRQPDCRHAGWLLTGFPMSEGQARFLAQDVELCPSHVFLLHAEEAELVRRSTQRYFNPATGECRLVEAQAAPPAGWAQRPQDKRAIIQARIRQVAPALEEVRTFFAGDAPAQTGHLGEQIQGALTVVPQGPEQTVFENLVRLVQNPRVEGTFANVHPTQ